MGDVSAVPDSVRASSSGRKPPEPVDPAQVRIETALGALADPIRLSIVRIVADAPDWSLVCGSFELPVTKATRSYHFTVLREAGLIEMRDYGSRRSVRLRRLEFDARFPGLLDLILAGE
jgi:DNA-binding transcriptional ArsR family regulator